MVSFDVKALLKNVPLEYTIDLVLKRIYENHDILASIARSVMKEILLLCTKNVHFTFRIFFIHKQMGSLWACHWG